MSLRDTTPALRSPFPTSQATATFWETYESPRDGEVFAIDRATNQLLRFSINGRLLEAFILPLIAGAHTYDDEYVSAFAVDETGENLWVATSFRCLYTSGRLILVDRTTGRVLSAIQPETASPQNWFVALATVSEWRAALSRPSSRRHAVGH